MTNPNIIFLSGPTASGKSSLAMQLARHYPIEIISVDSAMIYRGMDIGTAKPTQTEQADVPHHLIDILDPAEPYSVGQFCQDAQRLVEEIHSREHIPLLVGGTMLYFRALEEGIANLPESNPNIRYQIESQARELGWPAMHERLMVVDPTLALRLEPMDKQRIGRALEVYEICGVPLSELQKQRTPIFRQQERIHLALLPENRQILHETIADRFDQMLRDGFEDEVRQLFDKKELNKDLPSIRCVGYRQMWSYLSGEIDAETMREKAIAATRQLAKRQMTWINNWPTRIETIAPGPEAFLIASKILETRV